MVSTQAHLVRQWHRDQRQLQMINEYHRRLVRAYRHHPGPQLC